MNTLDLTDGKELLRLMKKLDRQCVRTIAVARQLRKVARGSKANRGDSGHFSLSWIDSLKQWRKRRKINGKTKTFYLGTGNGKEDRESYDRALAKWKGIAKALDQGTYPNLTVTTPAPAKIRRTLGIYIDEYVKYQRSRYDHGLKFPSAPQNERISGARFLAYRYNANLIKEQWGNEAIPKNEIAIAMLMRCFRDSQKTLMNDGKIQPGTINERIKTMRHLVKWLHNQYVIPELPRQMSSLCCKYSVSSSAKALDLDTIKTLWNAATSRFKTYIALALNCGFYAIDISNLEHTHIQGDFILCDRHKTKVPTRFKLWAVTKQLLSENCDGPDRLAFKARRGGPLMVIDPDANSGKGRRWCEIEHDLAALKKRLQLKLSFSMFRDTSSTMIEGIDRTLTDMFDGHKDGRMARYYVDGQKLDYDRMFARLDVALGEMEKLFALTVDANPNISLPNAQSVASSRGS